MTRVLVTDGDQRAALAVTRSLGMSGCEVGIAAPAARSIAGASRWALWREVVPLASDDPAGFAARCEGIVRSRAIDVLLPITESSLLALLPRRPALAPAVLPFPDLETFAAVADKGRVLAAAARLGIAVPAAVRLEARAGGLGRAADRLRFPVVVKPERSVKASGTGLARLAVSHAADRAELDRLLETLPDEAFPLQIQERIVGPGTGLFFLIWDGKVMARFSHRRLREKPPAGGVSVYSESVPVDEPLAALAVELLRTFAWRGVAMVEFKRDAATGTPYLMEINGRFWGSLQLAIDSGVDFPRLLVALAMGHPVAAITTYRAGVRCRWFWGDVDQLVTRLKRSAAELHLPPGTPGLGAMLARVLVPGASPGRGDVFRFADPKPGLVETIEWFRSLR